MPDTLLAYDLGTGGNKASLYDPEGRLLATAFVPYATHYPQPGWHEQRPRDWWDSVVHSTRELLRCDGADPRSIRCLALSGHSLGCVPLDAHGQVLREATPIWSDSRPVAQSERFLRQIDPIRWYRLTGNGFPAPHYTLFKIQWYRDCEPEMFRQIDKVLGTKDYINFRLTGRIATDYSYASGLGAYDLLRWDYSDELLEAAELSRKILPEIIPSTEIVGRLSREAADSLGLPVDIPVAAGGVDNSCMALGARNVCEGRVYASLGSSMWIAVSSGRPLLDDGARPYVFTHVVPGLFASAVAIFSGGTSLRWVKDQLCRDIVAQAERDNADPYDRITALAEQSPVGARNLLFNPSLAGGSSLEPSPHVRGALLGLDLGHTQADVLRATLEGIALNLRLALDELRRLGPISDEMVVVGGGSRSAVWRQIFADALEINVLKSKVGQDAGSLGAAAVAAVACGMWNDFTPIDNAHQIESVARPKPDNVAVYRELLPIFHQSRVDLARMGDAMASIERRGLRSPLRSCSTARAILLAIVASGLGATPSSGFTDTWDPLSAERAHAAVGKEIEADVCIVGAGSGGVAAAIAAGREDASVVLVERQRRLGGTGTNAFVSNWEPGPGCSIAEGLYRGMKAIGGAGVGESLPVQTKAPMGFLMVRDDLPYEKTLVRSLPGDRQRTRVPYCVPYKPAAFDQVARQMLRQTGNVTILDETVFFRAEANSAGTRVQAILVENSTGLVTRIRASVFIDATGDVWLARAVGCETMIGVDPKSRFDEPSAPETGFLQLNAITRCYSIVPSESPEREPEPQPDVRFPRAAFVTGWIDGVRMVNMMPTLPGEALVELGYDECMRRSERIVRAHWHWLQEMPEFRQYELAEIAPMLGIREGYRVVTRYVLNEHDLVDGLPHQKHPDMIAVADHPCDIHGAGGGLVQVNTAYGVPYRCLIPTGAWENLLIACRGAGFSKIAASSVRLQRTMIQIGHAAGMAAAMAAKANSAVDRIDVPLLVTRLNARSRYPIEKTHIPTGPVPSPFPASKSDEL